MVYQLTGSSAWLSVVLGVNMIPTVLFQPLFGALTEYFNKKKVIVYCDVGRGLVVLTTCFLLMAGVLEPWHLLILTFLNSSIEALRIPNGLAILPQILKKEKYQSAISLDQGTRRTAELIGMGCAGIIIGGLGMGGALFVDAVTFLISGGLLSRLRTKQVTGKKERFQIKSYVASLKEGVVYFRKSDLAMVVCAICVLQNLCTLPIENLQAAYISEYLGLDVMAMSVGGTAITIGMIAGALLLPTLSKRVSEKQLLIYGGVLFVSRTPKEMVGRIGGIFNALACSSLPVGSFVLAGLSMALSIRELYVIMGFLSMAVFMLMG